jgi:hypothetical protein
MLKSPGLQRCGQILQYPLCGVVFVKLLFSGFSIDGANDAVMSIVAAIFAVLTASSDMPASVRNIKLFIYLLLRRLSGISLH